ncbi:MAG: alpha-amylase family glycosyl hydrolase [Coriobacteriales bacterium]|nr:alpha-amylase family glycosyl hydrolase [Coriobacteriales bacterium]
MERIKDALKRIKDTIYMLFYILLCLMLANVTQQGGSEKVVTSPVQMIDYNNDLVPAVRDDKYRTTYEIFVYSFCDSNGDGIGDINGIRNKLDYISGMGFDQLWLTPVHPSATYHKYDVDDYYAIDPTFGTLEDYEALLAECHERGIRVLMDLVLNHTSDTHPWFQAAADYLRKLPSDQDPVFEDCPYVWYYTFSREPYDGFVPLEGTNWYYEARFWSEMPDLNLGNEVVRDEVTNIMSYWLGKGVDGFRLDAVTSFVTGNPEANIEFLRFLTDTGRSINPDCYLVGEAWTDRASIATLYTSGIDSLFDFPFADSEGIIRNVMNGSYAASDYVKAMTAAEAAYGEANPDYVGAPFYTNHDMGRSAGYYALDDGPVTKMAYALSLFMPGNSFVYYGEEIGMKGSGKDENKRAPMYWSDDANAEGMCVGPADMDDVQMKFPSLEVQMTDDLSLWRWFTEVIKVRRAFPAIARGVTEPVDAVSDGSVAAFIRRSEGDEAVLVVMNLRDQATAKDLSVVGSSLRLAAVLGTNEESITYENGSLSLPAYSIAVLTF